VIAPTDIPDMGTPNSFKNLANSVGAMLSLIRVRWADIKSRTAITEEELEEAFQATDRLSLVVLSRDFGPAAVSRATAVRQRAFTLLSKTYEELVRCFTFLRWYDGDVDKFTPSLYRSQRTRSERRDRAETEKASTETVNGAPSNGSNGSNGSNATTAGAPAPKPAANEIPAGLPGSRPMD
jgi:hypothetical protein